MKTNVEKLDDKFSRDLGELRSHFKNPDKDPRYKVAAAKIFGDYNKARSSLKFAGVSLITSSRDENRELLKKLRQLKGCVIVNIGFHPNEDEGGLTIDFCRDGGKIQRIVLGYTELGTWVDYIGPAQGD